VKFSSVIHLLIVHKQLVHQVSFMERHSYSRTITWIIHK